MTASGRSPTMSKEPARTPFDCAQDKPALRKADVG